MSLLLIFLTIPASGWYAILLARGGDIGGLGALFEIVLLLVMLLNFSINFIYGMCVLFCGCPTRNETNDPMQKEHEHQ